LTPASRKQRKPEDMACMTLTEFERWLALEVGHMRWTRDGANSLLQVRCAVLNGLDLRNFMRWYPPGKQFAPLPRASLLS
jgi:hypothetical protein